MLNTIIKRVSNSKYIDYKSLTELNLLLKATTYYLSDKLNSYNMYGEYDITECISGMNIILETNHTDSFGSNRLDRIKSEALLVLNKLHPSFYKDINNNQSITASDELALDLLIIEQKNIDFLNGQEISDRPLRLDKYYVILGNVNSGNIAFTKQPELPLNIKNEITAAFQKWKTSASSLNP